MTAILAKAADRAVGLVLIERSVGGSTVWLIEQPAALFHRGRATGLRLALEDVRRRIISTRQPRCPRLPACKPLAIAA